jgi:hypothetical protein
MYRRDFLISLSAAVTVSQIMTTGFAGSAAAATPNTILDVSRIITGNDNLSPEVAERVATVLSKRIDGFDAKLQALAQALASKPDRDAALAALPVDQVAFALDIAKPWYVGYVGTPSNAILKDDAEFVTFLEAQSYVKFLDKWPRPGDPGRAPGWWVEPPEGTDTSMLAPDIKSWSHVPTGVPTEIQDPDPAWFIYVTKSYSSLQAAREALANGSEAAPDYTVE